MSSLLSLNVTLVPKLHVNIVKKSQLWSIKLHAVVSTASLIVVYVYLHFWYFPMKVNFIYLMYSIVKKTCFIYTHPCFLVEGIHLNFLHSNGTPRGYRACCSEALKVVNFMMKSCLHLSIAEFLKHAFQKALIWCT